MPKTTRSGKTKKSELPSTLQRSGEKAQDTFAKAHDSALKSYQGDERAAHQVGFSALKHTHEKVGDHWEPKEHKGPSDPQAALGTPASRDRARPTAQGVDANASTGHLEDVARRVGIDDPQKLNRDEVTSSGGSLRGVVGWSGGFHGDRRA